MGAFGDRQMRLPLTNRGVELAEACFRRRQNTDRGPHDSGQIEPCYRGESSTRASKYLRPKGSGV